MTTRILIAYGSKYGATADIAANIGATLRAAGFSADVLPVADVHSLGTYGAVVLGSAVYMGGWRKDAAAFLEAHAEALAGMPVWLFSSGPTGAGDASALMNGFTFPEALKPLAERIKPHDIAFFHGVLDTKKLNFGERLIVKGIKAPLGDFRDWDAISTWAAGIGAALRQPQP